jgi:hypothetical protein
MTDCEHTMVIKFAAFTGERDIMDFYWKCERCEQQFAPIPPARTETEREA